MSVFHPVLLVFAAILVFSSYKLITEGEGDEDEDLTDNQVVAVASRFLDATDSYDGDNFFTMVRGSALQHVLWLYLHMGSIGSYSVN